MDTQALVALEGVSFWPLQAARELDDVLLHLRNNEFEIGTLIFKNRRRLPIAVVAYDTFLDRPTSRIGWRTKSRSYGNPYFKRIDVTSRSLAGDGRAGLMLCRYAGGNRFCLRPLLHADRPEVMATIAPPARDCAQCGELLAALSDG